MIKGVPESMTATLPQLPVILIHGLGGFNQIQFKLAGPLPITIVYFKGIADCLREVGVARVLAPELPPADSVGERAAALGAFIERQAGESRVHLVAHSMGGLDSRHYITHLGGVERVCSLTTIGTPHRGSSLATLSTDAFLDPALRLVEMVHLDRWFDNLGRATLAHTDLRPDSCAAFNERTPDMPGVVYQSWAGDPPAGGIQVVLKLSSLLLARLEEGPNDGLVSVASARWSGWRGTIPADHLSMIGWQLSERARRHFNPEQFYLSMMSDLAAAEGANLLSPD